MKKKLLALLLTLVMLLNMVPTVTAADDSGHDHAAAACTDAACDEHAMLAATPRSSDCAHVMSGWMHIDSTQHTRYCMACHIYEEYAPHTGGDGSCKPVCEGCGEVYPDPDGEHRNMSAWRSNNDQQHSRYCYACGEYEYAAHVDLTSDGKCDDCGHVMPCTHANMSDWKNSDSTQHRRTCQDCGEYTEYGSHSGGTAACKVKAICEACGGSYGSFDPNNHRWDEWVWIDYSIHTRMCLDCRTEEEGNHSGGNGSCRPMCEKCGGMYSNVNGRHIDMGKWFPYSDTQHFNQCQDCSDYFEYADHVDFTGDGLCDDCSYVMFVICTHANMSAWSYIDEQQHSRYCLDCGEAKEYAPHTGGDGSCMPKCEGCGYHYPNPGGEHRDMSIWYKRDDQEHYRYCRNCGEAKEYAPHTNDGSCKPTCEDCGHTYSNPGGEHRNMTDWGYYDGQQHYRYCRDCTALASYEYAPHTGGDGSCMPVCEDCGDQYLDANGEHRNTAEWIYLNDQQHVRSCLDCNEGEYADHTGGDGSCKPICEDCGGQYHDANGEHRIMSGWLYHDGQQHYRRCGDCDQGYEYAPHTGGTATCRTYAECEECGADYGAFDPDKHTTMTDWLPYSDTQHVRYCRDCNSDTSCEYADHTGGTATCSSLAECEVCGSDYGELDNEHTNISAWKPHDDTHHIRSCNDCGENVEYGDHTGGTATCISLAECEVCGRDYGELAPDNHANMTEWMLYDSTQHWRYCTDCLVHNEFEDHTGNDGSCVPFCSVCKQHYYNENGKHGEMSEWHNLSDTQHFRYCLVCDNYDEYGDHTGGTATCTGDGVCEVCEGAYISATDHSWGEWKSNGVGTHTRVCKNDAKHTETEDCTGGTATCTEDGVCELCEGAYIPATDHSWGEWKSNNDGTHTRVCANDATHTETEDCTGGTATCTDTAICEVCGSEHGAVLGHIPGTEADCINDQVCTREGCGELLTEKLGHDYTAVVTKPTCTEQGYTTYTCSRCEDSYQADQTAARGHWYDLWYPNGDGTDSADCKRYGCSHEGTAECTLYEVTEKDGETETILTVCPVCGDHERATFGVVSGDSIKNVFINQPLPRGEQIVRELDAPFDGVLYAFTAAYESAGRVMPFNGKVSVSLPLDAEKYAEFRLVRVDVTPETETTERTEVWTDVAFTFENGRLIFETDVAGLFLLVPME